MSIDLLRAPCAQNCRKNAHTHVCLPCTECVNVCVVYCYCYTLCNRAHAVTCTCALTHPFLINELVFAFHLPLYIHT